ncbi:hypothetical protein MNV49_001777 [Pseudohyphozyma bogoriensis]|nr:hypothetical protein MNV49_001777 [Pseudohyphozyma bogoriensis]
MSIGATTPISVVTVGTSLPASSLEKLRTVVPTVNYYPKGDAPSEILAETQVYLSPRTGTPTHIEDIKAALPKLQHIQMPVAGAEKIVKNVAILKAMANGDAGFTVSTASGVHAVSIPQYIAATILALYLRLPKQILVARNEARWASGEDIAEGVTEPHDGNDTPYYVRSLRGKTVGFLGYGHIARAAARLLPAFGVNIIAANTSGDRRVDEGYMIPGTGDKEAALPSEMYSTSDEASLNAFLAKSDILVCSLPSTPASRGFLTKERFSMLPKEAVLINVGRGDLFTSEDLIWACDQPNGLWGAAVDVTDPEPLPEGHPLYKHHKVIVTPHLSGDCEDELALGAEIMAYNIQRLNEGKKPINIVDFGKGY